MVNGFRYYRALESVSIASALSTALTIYPCQIRVHQCWQSKFQLPTARKKEWRPATAHSSPPCGYLSTLIHTTLVGLEPATFRSLVRRATSSATEPRSRFTSAVIRHKRPWLWTATPTPWTNTFSRPTMTNATLYIDSYINIAVNFPSANFLLFDSVLSIYNKRICYVMLC